MSSPSRISVLGGGLTGLSSAFHLSRRFPHAKVTLLERSPRLGGWVDSERVHVKDSRGNEAEILLERGPRTLRPNSKAVLELLNLLELSSELVTVPKTAPAARTRFLRIPGTHGLTALPSSILSMFTTSLGRSMLLAGMAEPLRSYRHAPVVLDALSGDESVDQFLFARLGPELARVLGSALVHGIYAADSRVLSVRAAFPSLWTAAEAGRGSLVRGMLLQALSSRRSSLPDTSGNYDLGDVLSALANVSVYSFRDGMTTLTRALEHALRKRGNVEIVSGDAVASISTDGPGSDIVVRTDGGRAVTASHLVSAIRLPALKSLLERSALPALPHLSANPMSSVTVVNLVFPPLAPNQRIHPDGFGYLIPRGKDDEAEVLGTVFDSCSLGAQDHYPTRDAPRFTKMTMMIRLEPSSTPVTQDRVMAFLTEHLAPSTPLPQPVLFRVHDLRDCIPTPSVGHVQRMKELRDVADGQWGGRLEVIGAGVGGVSVGDCIEQGRQAGDGW